MIKKILILTLIVFAVLPLDLSLIPQKKNDKNLFCVR